MFRQYQGEELRAALSRSLTPAPSGQCYLGERISILEETRALDRFLAGVERRAFWMLQIATGHDDEALDLVQEAMLKLVERYGTRDEAEWRPLFHRILQSEIRDWYRRTNVRSRWRLWLGRDEDGEEASDPLAVKADTTTPTADHQLKINEASSALDAALRTLPLRQQQAFLLRGWEELDVRKRRRRRVCSIVESVPAPRPTVPSEPLSDA